MRTKSSSLILHPSSLRRAFTLVELLVVIGIIAILAALLFPVIGKVQQSARETDTRAFIQSIEAAAMQYRTDFNAYPGPLSSAYVTAEDQSSFPQLPANWQSSGIGQRVTVAGNTTDSASAFNDGIVDSSGIVQPGERVTQGENLTLGLLGGVFVNRTAPNACYLEFDATTVGQGAASLNPVKPGRNGTYMQAASLSKSTQFKDGNGALAKDSRIPEFVDHWPEAMPILVLRARIGGRGAPPATAYDAKNNDVVVNLPSSDVNSLHAVYNLVEITPYTQSKINGGGSLKPSEYKPAFDPMTSSPHGLTGIDVTKGLNKANAPEYIYPFEALSYLADPSSYTMTDDPTVKIKTMKARKPDTLILISAGKDRIYGTADDVTNFGSVLP